MNKTRNLIIISLSSILLAQGINPLTWSPVEEDNRFIQQVWGQVCNGTGILNSDTDVCNTQWGQHQLEIDIDNDGDNDFIAKVYEDWHTGFQGLGVFKNVYNEDSNNVFVLDSIYRQCGSHGGISAGYFNDDEFIDIYFSTGGYHGPEWMLPDLDCLEQDFFYLGTSTGEFLQDTLDNSLPTQDSFWIEGFRQDVFDVNNDGIDEIIASYYFTNSGEYNIAILSYNEGIQNFDTLDVINPLGVGVPADESGGRVFEWKTADLNGDGWNDMIVTTQMDTDEFWINDIYAYWGDGNGLNFDSPTLLASIPALYGALSMVGDEESLTPLDYDSNGDDEILMWFALFNSNLDYATIPIDSLPQAELRLYDLQGDTLIDITDDAFFEGDNNDFNSQGNGVFIKDLNNDGVDDILFSTTWCLEKVNISGVDPGSPGSMGDNECASFALNLDGKFHLYEVEPTGAGPEEQTIQQFSIELDNYENDTFIYLDFYDQTYDCSAGNDLSDPDWFPEDWPAQIWHYSNQVEKIMLNSNIDSTNADTIQTLAWVSDIVADIYRVQLSLDNFGEDVVLDTLITDTLIIIDSLLPESNYSVRVRGENEAGQGLWSDTLNFTTIFLESDKEKSFLPKKFALHQNFPNPFNPITTLRYDLPEDSFVKITVYDILGNVVNNILNQKEESGYKLVQWNAINNQGQPVSAGLYLYSIEAGEFRKTKKMILLK
jgi:hypothetical protein